MIFTSRSTTLNHRDTQQYMVSTCTVCSMYVQYVPVQVSSGMYYIITYISMCTYIYTCVHATIITTQFQGICTYLSMLHTCRSMSSYTYIITKEGKKQQKLGYGTFADTMCTVLPTIFVKKAHIHLEYMYTCMYVAVL